MKISLKHLVGGALTGFILVLATLFSLPDGKLHLVFCDVGQGDAIYIRTSHGHDILVDGGPNEKVLTCLGHHLPFYDRTIELMVLSHPQADHLNGLISVLQRYSVEYFVSSGIENQTQGYQQLKSLLKSQKIVQKSESAGGKIVLDNLSLTSLWPPENILGATIQGENINEVSLVSKLSYGQFDALFTGDISFEIEEKIDSGEVEVLKVAHHGSKYSTGQDFLAKIKPVLAVISVGKNAYGHPAEETLGVLRDFGVEILRTDNDGEIEIVSDGKRWWRKN